MSWRRFLTIGTLVAAGAHAIAAEPWRKPPDAPATPAPTESDSDEPAWLGMFLGDAPDGGVKVVVLADGGPAAKAGIREGDLVIAVNDKPVTDRRVLRQVLGGLRPGEKVSLETLRDGKAEIRVVQAEPRVIRLRIPGIAPDGSVPDWSTGAGSAMDTDVGSAEGGPAGATIVAIPPDLRRHYGAPADAGVLVAAVAPGGRAGAAGVKVGDVIVRAGGAPVREPGDLELRLLRQGSSVPLTLQVLRGGKPLAISVPASRPARSDEERARRLAEIAAEMERLASRMQELRREIERIESGR